MIKIVRNINKILNIVIIGIVIFILFILILSLIEPLLYNNGSKGKYINDDKKIILLEDIVNTYLFTYINDDGNEYAYEMFNKYKRTDKIKSDEVSKNIRANYKKVIIDNIEESFNNVYIVYYSINKENKSDDGNINKIIIKLNERKGIFEIYYDSMIENY